MYPAISHFADAIAALPREYRRHTSLLKEVDAKAWGPEESLQTVLDQCLADSANTTRNLAVAAQSLTDSTIADDPLNLSEVNSVAGASFDNASLASVRSVDPIIAQRRQQYHTLRQNLMAIMVTMDEKNHVINNANEEVARHIRRLDRIWPHIADEISEDARLGSLKHWAYTETNPTKKPTAATTRREAAAASLATLHESEAAHRSQDRREAVRRQRATAQHVDSDFDDSRLPARKVTTNGKKRVADAAPDPTGLGISGAGTGKRKKPEKPVIGGATMERSISSALGGRPMSRENSQQENSKKRKASGMATSVARKRYVEEVSYRACANVLCYRINAATQDSPKLASSPLAGGATGKEAYKRSPALSTVRPAMARGRQNSLNAVETSKANRPSSLTSNKNGKDANNAGSAAETSRAASTSSKTVAEAKHHARETKTEKTNRLLDSEAPIVNGANGDYPLKASLLIERSSSRHEAVRGEARDEVSAKGIASPRLPALQTSELKSERSGRGRASKTSTPVVGTFADAEAENALVNGNGGSKPKRPPRNRVKDHGLHDSLSPKGLPMKRMHKKSASLSFPFPTQISNPNSTQRVKDDADATTKSSTPSEQDLATPINLPTDIDMAGAEEEEEEEHEAAEDDEERYCYCQGVSYGEMVACDRDDCPRQWFHLDCIGLKSVPKSAKWYCDECKNVLAHGDRTVAKAKNGNGSGSSNGNGNGTGK